MIIADDEQRIRNGLVNNIDWEKLGFQVVADFMDGQDVIDYLQKEDVDVIFTDVQMCQVSGLEVARWTQEKKPEVKVVIISGYKEFEYVKEAIELKVYDYVLKPIQLAEVKSTFMKIRTELEERDREEGKSIQTLFSYQEDPECIKVLQEEAGIIELISGAGEGKKEKLKQACRQWRRMILKVNPEYVPLLARHVLDELFRRLDKEGICLEGDYEKSKVYQCLSSLQGEELITKVGELLSGIMEKIEKKKSTVTEDVIARAKEYIEVHLAEDFGVEELAAYVYLNRSYLSREFKNATGVSVMEYIIQRRMEKAMELIRQGKLSTEKIAKQVGYTDVKYFQRSFKKYTGHTIREYRSLLR